MTDQSPNMPKEPNQDQESPEGSDHSTVSGEIVDAPTSADLEIPQGPGTLITPGEAMPVYNIARLKAAMADNDLTPEFLIERLALFANHPNPSYALGAMRLLCSHISDVLKMHGITVKAEAPTPKPKETPNAQEEPDDAPEDPVEEPAEEPPEEPERRISGTRLALDLRSVQGGHPWATLRRSTRGTGGPRDEDSGDSGPGVTDPSGP